MVRNVVKITTHLHDRNPTPSAAIYAQSIKHLHNATHGRGGADPRATSNGSTPCIAKRRRLGGLKVPTLAARVETWGKPQL